MLTILRWGERVSKSISGNATGTENLDTPLALQTRLSDAWKRKPNRNCWLWPKPEQLQDSGHQVEVPNSLRHWPLVVSLLEEVDLRHWKPSCYQWIARFVGPLTEVAHFHLLVMLLSLSLALSWFHPGVTKITCHCTCIYYSLRD